MEVVDELVIRLSAQVLNLRMQVQVLSQENSRLNQQQLATQGALDRMAGDLVVAEESSKPLPGTPDPPARRRKTR